MKILLTILMSLTISSYSDNKTEVKKCFSENNFDIVHQYIHEKLTLEKDFYTCNGCGIYLKKEEIILKNNGFTMAKITKSKGIFALAMRKSDNERQQAKAEEIFCRLLFEAENK